LLGRQQIDFASEDIKSIVLFMTSLSSIPLGILSSVLLTNYLGVESYGDYRLILSIFLFTVVLFNFGLFQSANRLIVQTKSETDISDIYGTVAVIIAGLSALSFVVLLVYANIDSNLSEKGISSTFQFVSILVVLFFVQNALESLLHANGRINLLSESRITHSIYFIVILYIVLKIDSIPFGNKLLVVWSVFFLAKLLSYAPIILRLKPQFSRITIVFRSLLSIQGSYGLKVYYGSLISVGVSELMILFLSYTLDNNLEVGLYSLAFTIASPIALLTNVVATTHYRSFASSRKIPYDVLLKSVAITILCAIIVLALSDAIVSMLFPADFAASAPLIRILVIAFTFHGIADLFNRYLGANGDGEALRNSSFIVGVVLIGFSLTLIPYLGSMGAALAKLLGSVAYFISIYVYYKRRIK